MSTADQMNAPRVVRTTNMRTFIFSRPAGIEIMERNPGSSLAMKTVQAPLESIHLSPVSSCSWETPILPIALYITSRPRRRAR